MTIKIHVKTENDIDTLNNNDPISLMTLTIIAYINLNEKKIIPIFDRDVIDSVKTSLKLNIPVNKQIAKLNDVYAILEIVKGNKKIDIEIFNSKYTGWILTIGNKQFTNDYIFKLTQSYLKH